MSKKLEAKFSLLLGFPRSGTTWIHNCCTYGWRVGRIAEPDNPENNPDASWEMSSRFSPAGSADVVASKVFDPVFGRPSTFNSRHRLLRPLARHYCIKSVLGMMMGEWLQRYDRMPVCFVARNPIPVVASCLKMIRDPFGFWECLRAQKQLEPVLNDFWDVVQTRPPSAAAAIATVWAAQHLVVLKQLLSHPDWSLLKYEDICVNPVAGIAKVARSLGLPFGVASKVRVLATTHGSDGRFHGIRRNTSAMASNWRQSASSDIIRDVVGVCAKFGFPIYDERELG